MLNKDIIAKLKNCNVISTVRQEDDENEWLAVRSHGIGGSDIGAICGVSQFTSARQIYIKKTGQYDDAIKESNASMERMHFGHMLEPIVANEYSVRNNARIIEIDATFSHKDYPWALANIDRLIVDNDNNPIGILECKTASEYMNEEWEDGNIPVSYIYQLNWYLWILDIPYGVFACLVGGNKFYQYEVFRNDELINSTMLPMASKFWNDNVLKLVEPDMQQSDTEYANLKYASVVKNSEIVLDDDISNELAKTVHDCKAKIKELTNIMESAQNKLKDKLKDNEIGYCRDFTIKWSPRKQARVDTEKLKKEFPEVYEACKNNIEYRVMFVKGGI